MKRVSRFERLDGAGLKPPVRLDNGFLKVEGRLARVGIQEYRDDQGKIRRELRLPEEVFDTTSLESFQQVPVTDQHPPTMLTAENAKMFSVGNVGENVRREGDFIVAPLMITDAGAIANAERGRSQLSNGYTCVLDYTVTPELTEKWGRYDAIQRQIRGNHVALVDIARAGADARIRLDSGDAEAIFRPEEKPVLRSNHKERKKMLVKVDGFTFETEDANAQAAIDRALDAVRKDGEVKISTLEKTNSELQKELDTAKAKFDALEAASKADAEKMVECDECGGSGKVDGDACPNCEGKGEMAAKEDAAKRKDSLRRRIDRGVARRAALVLQAGKILGANEKLDARSDREIRALVVAKMFPSLKDTLEGRSDDGIGALYEAAILREAPPTVSAPKREDSETVGANRSDERPQDAEEARQKMVARVLEMNRKK